MELGLNSAAIRFARHVSFRRMGAYGIILETESGKTYKCNSTAAEVLSCVNGNRSIDDITNMMLRKYDDPTQILPDEIQSLMARLETKGLLDRSHDSPPRGHA